MTMKKLSQGLDQVWFQIPEFLLLAVIVWGPKAVTTASKHTSLPSVTLVHWSSHTNIRTGRFLAGSWGRRLCKSPDKDRSLGLGAEPILFWGDLAGLFWNQTHLGRGSDTTKVSSGQDSGVINHDLASWVLCSFLAHFCYCLGGHTPFLHNRMADKAAALGCSSYWKHWDKPLKAEIPMAAKCSFSDLALWELCLLSVPWMGSGDIVEASLMCFVLFCFVLQSENHF